MSIITFFGLAALVALSNGYKDCIKVPSTPLSESFLLESGKNGFYVIETSNCNNCEKDEDWKWVKGRSDVKKSCWDFEIITKDGTEQTLPFHCEYNAAKAEDENCKLDFTNAKGTKASWAASTTATMTDNKTYFAGVACIHGKENFWFIASTSPTMDAELLTKIKAHFTSLGYTAKVAVAKEAPVFFKKLTIKTCAA